MQNLEKDPLLNARDKPWKAMTPRGVSARPVDEKDNERGHRNCWNIVFGWVKHTFIPAFLFMAVSILFMVGYHQNPRLLLGLAAFLAVALCSDALYIYGTRSKCTKEVVAFTVCAFAVCAGGVVGTSLHLTQLHDYWPYYQKRHYTNVAPDELAAAHADASVLVFMEGTKPDATRYAGYYRYGNVYCVAPIAVEPGYIEGEDTISSNVQYWAVGKNCCGGHKGFSCDDSHKSGARSGLVMTKKTEDDTLLQGILSGDEETYYEKAVHMSLTKFDLTSPSERMYVRFVKDIDAARMTYWWTAWLSWWKLQVFWLPLWTFAGAVAVVVGAGDPEDDSRYSAHIVDFKQSVLYKLNHYI